MKTLSQEYLKESEGLKKLLKSIKKSEVSSEEYQKLAALLQLSENNSKSFFNSQNSKAALEKDYNEKINLFNLIPSKNTNFSESEITEFIGSLNNNDVIRQYYIVENLKSKINTSFNENIENKLNKIEQEKAFKKYDTLAQNYLTNKNKILDDYIKNYKVAILYTKIFYFF